ncbi:tyrosine-protein phosphatase [Caulobacter segnis]
MGYDRTAALTGLMKMTTREAAIQGFADAYVDFLDLLAPHYTDMFARLLANQGPLALNCSAGKDRTGMAAALILSVLGASRQTIIADYALSETYVPTSRYLEQAAQRRGLRRLLVGPSPRPWPHPTARGPARDPGLAPEVMRRALATIDTRFGSADRRGQGAPGASGRHRSPLCVVSILCECTKSLSDPQGFPDDQSRQRGPCGLSTSETLRNPGKLQAGPL